MAPPFPIAAAGPPTVPAMASSPAAPPAGAAALPLSTASSGLPVLLNEGPSATGLGAAPALPPSGAFIDFSISANAWECPSEGGVEEGFGESREPAEGSVEGPDAAAGHDRNDYYDFEDDNDPNLPDCLKLENWATNFPTWQSHLTGLVYPAAIVLN